MTKASDLQPKGLPCGIYFDLPDKYYRADSALNYSSMKMILSGGSADFWENSCLNKAWKPQAQTEDMRLGQILHTMLLEEDKFYQRYYITPMQTFVENKMPIRQTDYVWMEAMTKELLSFEIPQSFLTRGKSEVVIIWRDPETGLRMKAKHDYWKSFCSVDYKTISSVKNEEISRAMWKYRYDIQAHHYTESRKVIRQMLIDGTADVFGEGVDMKMIDNFINGQEGVDGIVAPKDYFVFIFQAKKSPYQFQILDPSEDMFHGGRTAAAEAARLYVWHMEKYGPNVRWPANTGEIKEFSMRFGIQEGARQYE